MSEELTPPRFPTMLRKMWRGDEVQAWIDEEWNRRAQPAAQALPAITEQQSKWGRLYTAANALVVQMGYRGSMQADSIEMESLKDKLHDLDGGEWMPGLMPPAQPVAPADAAPSVAPEPPTRETLAEIVRSHLTSTYHCVRVWEAWHVGTMTEDDFEPASESDMAEDIADAILAAHPPRAPLTEGARMGIYMEFDRHADKTWTPTEYLLRFAAAVDAHGIRGQG